MKLPPENMAGSPALRATPRGFALGAATSSHQVEGDNDGNDWWEWEQRPGKIADGTRSGAACEWWAGRAEDDLATARALGMDAFRISLEWSRCEPEPGRYDDGAFARYAAVLDHMARLGLRAHVTLHHFTLPRWAAHRGSWVSADLPERFEAYARECARRLGERCTWIATMNEPMVAAFMGYMGRAWPPGLGDFGAGLRAARNMVRAHRRAYRAIGGGAVPVGIVLNMPVFDPASASPADHAAARAQDFAFNEAFLRSLGGAYDFLGLNYYGRYEVRFDPRATATMFGRHVQTPTVRTAHNDWGQIAPDGLRRQILRLARLGKPVHVTENGVMDPSDAIRPDYLRSHVRSVADAIAHGADVRGYFVWSLLDNFEWAEGWSAPFGLIALDRATQRRTPRPSADGYAQICRDHRSA